MIFEQLWREGYDKVSRISVAFLVTALISPCGNMLAQTSDNVFQYNGGNSWSTKDDGLPVGQPDDGIIRVNGSYSRDLGPDAHITINHKIDLSGESGTSGASGAIGTDISNINGENGTSGSSGGSFYIKGDSVVINPQTYTNPSTGFPYIVRSGVVSGGGSGGSGGDAGYSSNSDGTTTYGSPGAAGNGGGGGSITFDVHSVSFSTDCDIYDNPILPEISAGGGSGGSAGDWMGEGGDGFSGGAGGGGGTVSFVNAVVTMCPQDGELFAVDCSVEGGICGSTGFCNPTAPSKRLGYMRLPITASGGSGGNGGNAGSPPRPVSSCCSDPFYNYPACLDAEPCPCLGMSPSGGAGGAGGDGGDLYICSIHPILYSAGGGSGGNGGSGGGASDWWNYRWSYSGGAGGNGGQGGGAGEGCGAFSEAGSGSSGVGGSGVPALTWEPISCSNGAFGTPEVAIPGSTPTFDFANPPCGCGISITKIEDGSNIYDLGDTYSGSFLRGRNLVCHAANLKLYLQQGVSRRQIYRETPVAISQCEGDSLKFWINKDAGGNIVSFPAPGTYDLYITNESCDFTFEDAITITGTGSSCTDIPCSLIVELLNNEPERYWMGEHYLDPHLPAPLTGVPLVTEGGAEESSVWYKICPGTDKLVTVSMDPDNECCNASIHVYSGNCSNLTYIGFNDCYPQPEAPSKFYFASDPVIDQPYYIRLHGYVLNRGDIEASWISRGSAPVNDFRNFATQFTGSATFSGQLTQNATVTAGEGCSSGTGGDVWYKVKVPRPGTIISASFTHGASGGVVGVWTGSSCGEPVQQSCNSAGSGSPATVSYTTTNDSEMVWISIKSEYSSAQSLQITYQVPNNECASAQVLNCGDQVYGALTYGSTLSASAPGCASGSTGDIWYKVQIPSTPVTPTYEPGINIVFDDGNESGAAFVALYRSGCSDPSPICTNYRLGDGRIIVQQPALPGQTYYVRIGTASHNSEQQLAVSCFNKLEPWPNPNEL